jgi:hypothetical protein
MMYLLSRVFDNSIISINRYKNGAPNISIYRDSTVLYILQSSTPELISE